MKKQLVFKFIFSAIILLLGYFVAQELNSFLDIRFEDKTLDYDTSKPHTQSQKHDHRIVDFGGTGIINDTINWGDNYEHHVHRFKDMIQYEAPYINQTAFERIYQELDEYTNRMSEFEFNGIAMPGFIEYVNFEYLNDGQTIYEKQSDYYQRHLAIRKHVTNQ